MGLLSPCLNRHLRALQKPWSQYLQVPSLLSALSSDSFIIGVLLLLLRLLLSDSLLMLYWRKRSFMVSITNRNNILYICISCVLFYVSARQPKFTFWKYVGNVGRRTFIAGWNSRQLMFGYVIWAICIYSRERRSNEQMRSKVVVVQYKVQVGWPYFGVKLICVCPISLLKK